MPAKATSTRPTSRRADEGEGDARSAEPIRAPAARARARKCVCPPERVCRVRGAARAANERRITTVRRGPRARVRVLLPDARAWLCESARGSSVLWIHLPRLRADKELDLLVAEEPISRW